MPILDYVCWCGHRLEIIAKADHRHWCSKCGREMKRTIVPPAPPVVRGYNSENGYSK